MKKFFKSSKAKALSLSKGFTLIELLVVIAVLGILAIAIVAAINPLQKIKQAKDSTIKSDISQIANAMQAYYTNSASGGTTPWYLAAVADLVTNNEIKSEPKQPGTGASYLVTLIAGGCTTAGKDCTNIAVSAPLNAPATPGNVWCWRSSTGTAAETTVAACTAP